MSTTDTMIQHFEVVGMTCDHCARSVRKEIGRIDGVDTVAVDLVTGVVAVTSTAALDAADVTAAVEEAGYAMA